jgi:DNA-binding transcriptional ArsR family regulator
MPRQHQPNASVLDPQDPDREALDRVFSALGDPVRRAILSRLDGRELLVSEIAAPFKITLQAVSKHIHVLVKAGLVKQERTGRVSRCRLDAGPIYQAAVWINRYAKYWQAQFDLLAVVLEDMEHDRPRQRQPSGKAKRRAKASARRPAKVKTSKENPRAGPQDRLAR